MTRCWMRGSPRWRAYSRQRQRQASEMYPSLCIWDGSSLSARTRWLCRRYSSRYSRAPTASMILRKAFRRAGAEVETIVFRNQSESDILESVDAFEKAISQSQIIMFPGGFSAGDEPEGSAKFIASVFRNEKIKEAVMKLLEERDGLALGICNGFQALIKLGLLPAIRQDRSADRGFSDTHHQRDRTSRFHHGI